MWLSGMVRTISCRSRFSPTRRSLPRSAPELRMAISLRAFKIELYQEHLEEAAFLYQQRLALFRDPEISWRKIGEFEDRLEAHVDALVVGEELALEVCRARVKAGEPAELFPIVSVFCRQRR